MPGLSDVTEGARSRRSCYRADATSVTETTEVVTSLHEGVIRGLIRGAAVMSENKSMDNAEFRRFHYQHIKRTKFDNN